MNHEIHRKQYIHSTTDKGLAPYNSVKVVCSSVQEVIAYFHSKTNQDDWNELAFKVVLKTNKLYQWNFACMTWDTIENTLSGETVDDVWSKRMGNGSDYYSNVGQD